VGDQCHEAWAKYAQSNSGNFPHLDEVYCGYFDVLRQALTAPGRNLTSSSFTAALHQLTYDNGLFNPIGFNGGQVGSNKVVVWKADANSKNQNEIDGAVVRHPPEVILLARGTGGPGRQARPAARVACRPRRTRRVALHWPPVLRLASRP
jgi:hypothetical protein